jgi:hypothetical protein
MSSRSAWATERDLVSKTKQNKTKAKNYEVLKKIKTRLLKLLS